MDKKGIEPEIEFLEPSPWLKSYMKEMEKGISQETPKEKTGQKQPQDHKLYFGQTPHWIVSHGLLGILKPKATKLLAILIRYADLKTHNGRVGNKRISRECNIHVRSVPGYFRELKSFGIIKTWRKGWPRYYHIQSCPPEDIDERIEACFKPNPGDIYPQNMDTYLPTKNRPRDSKGRFKRGDKYP